MFKQLRLGWDKNWLRMVGDTDRFSLESRIFHSISITAIFSISVITIYGTMNEKGTGLGLVLCKDLIVQQNGKIWFTSTPEDGTTFYVERALT